MEEIRQTVVTEETEVVPAAPVTRVTNDYVQVVDRRPGWASIVYYILDVVEILLAMRLIFRALGANPNSPIVSFIYALTAPLIAPFAGIFPSPSASGSVIEWSTIVAMIIYALIAYLIVRLIRTLRSRKTTISAE